MTLAGAPFRRLRLRYPPPAEDLEPEPRARDGWGWRVYDGATWLVYAALGTAGGLQVTAWAETIYGHHRTFLTWPLPEALGAPGMLLAWFFPLLLDQWATFDTWAHRGKVGAAAAWLALALYLSSATIGAWKLLGGTSWALSFAVTVWALLAWLWTPALLVLRRLAFAFDYNETRAWDIATRKGRPLWIAE